VKLNPTYQPMIPNASAGTMVNTDMCVPENRICGYLEAAHWDQEH
jgi:hypothetical protein